MSSSGVKRKRDKNEPALQDSIDEKSEDKSKTKRSSFRLSNFFTESEKEKKMKKEWMTSVMQTSERLDKLSKDLDKIGEGLDKILAELKKLEDYPEGSLTRFEEMNSDFNDVITKHDEGKEKYAESMLSIGGLSKKMEAFIKAEMKNLPPNLQKEVEKLKKQINDAASNLATQMHTEPKLNNTTAEKLKKAKEAKEDTENLADEAEKAKLKTEKELKKVKASLLDTEKRLKEAEKKAMRSNSYDVSGGNDDSENQEKRKLDKSKKSWPTIKYEDDDESSEIDESEESGSTSKSEADDESSETEKSEKSGSTSKSEANDEPSETEKSGKSRSTSRSEEVDDSDAKV